MSNAPSQLAEAEDRRRRAPAGMMAVLVGTSSLGLAATSLYTPSLPAIARGLGASAAAVQQTFTVYFVTYAACMVVIGPLSDRFGRRAFLLGGTVLFAAASILAAFASSISMLLIGRALQAVAASAGLATARALARDVFDDQGTARAMAAISIALSVTPSIAPLVGGYVEVWFGWRANFALLALIALPLIPGVAKRVPADSRRSGAGEGVPISAMGGIARLVSDRRFIGYAFVLAASSSMYYGFISVAPIMMIVEMGVTPDAFGRYVIAGIFGSVLSAYLSARAVGRYGPRLIIAVGIGFFVSAALLLAALAAWHSPQALIWPLFLLGAGMGFAMPNSNARGLTVEPRLAGTAAGLLGCGQMGASSLVTAILGWHSTSSVGALVSCWAAGCVLAGLGYVLSRADR
jgi:MFS transporter, DHA1 family, multidrug resistance protein